MKPPKISDEELWAEYVAQGMNAGATAAAFGVPSSSVRDRVRNLKNKGWGRLTPSEAMLEDAGTRLDPMCYRGGNSLDELLQNHSIVPDNVDVQKSWVGSTAKVVKRADGSEDLRVVYKSSAQLGPKRPEWPLIQPPTPIRIQFPTMTELCGDGTPVASAAFIWPDTQIGHYRSAKTGLMVTFHDEAAIDVALQMLEAFVRQCALVGVRPEVVVLGDFLDLASMSRWPQYPEYQRVLQPTLNYAYHLLVRIRAIVGPTARIRYVPGNHERRLAEYVAKNAAELLGLRRAEKDIAKLDPQSLVSKEWGWPVNSVPHLLNLKDEDLQVDYLEEFPSAIAWITDTLGCVHRRPAKTEFQATIICGHEMSVDVRGRTSYKRSAQGLQREEYDTIIIPGLMRLDEVDDPVQLTRTNVPSNRGRIHNAQQAVGTVVVFPDGRHNVEIHRIKDGIGQFRDKQFRAGGSSVLKGEKP